jgi:hypothetical protein
VALGALVTRRLRQRTADDGPTGLVGMSL